MSFMKLKFSSKRRLGNVGEDYAADFYKEKGYAIVARNYLRKWGELDLVARKKNDLRFVEVKTITQNVKHETGDSYRPEENVHQGKLLKLGRIIETYLLDRHPEEEIEWQLDIAAVYVDSEQKMIRIEIIEDAFL